MKLIIDISEEDYNYVKKQVADGIINPLKMYITNGTPLDDVKADIEKQIKRDFAYAETETLKVPCHYGIANGLQNAIRFLDNIGKESKGKAE